jgi:hypothetical protein
MAGPLSCSAHPQHRRGRRLHPFLIALLWAPLGCSNDQPAENTVQAPPPAATRHPSLMVSDTGEIQLASARVGFSSGVSALGPANGPKVLILADADGPSTSALASSLTAAGYQVTSRPAPENTWNGSDPALTGFDAVIHLDGVTWPEPLPAAAQSELSTFVLNGGGYIGSQWIGYEQSTGKQTRMPNLVLLGYGNSGKEQECARCTVTYNLAPGHAHHPVVAGLPPSFTFSADGHHAGPVIPFLDNPSTMLMRIPSGNAAVIVRQYGYGKVVNFSFSANYGLGGAGRTLLDPNVQRLYLNALRWTAGSPPDGDADGIPDVTDNCPAASNPNQTDSNNNGMGDACEVDQPQSIAFGELSGKTFGDPDFTVSATASSGLPVSFAASGKCTVSDATVHLTGAGSCTITAQQGGNTNYRPAEPVSRSFAIGKATATLALTNLSHTYSGAPVAASAVTSPAGLETVTLTYNGFTDLPINAGSYTVTATLDHQDYQLSPVSGTLVIAKARATITVGTEYTYDGTPKSAAITTIPAGLVVVRVTYTQNGLVVASPVNAGTYQVLAQLENSNYEAPDARGTLTILPAAPTIHWPAPSSITVGTQLGPAQLNATATGIGDASVGGTFRYTPSAGTVLPIGSHSISVEFTPSDLNYSQASKTVQVAVTYPFIGFLRPLRNPPVFNVVRAGRAIPVRFSLGRNYGLQVMPEVPTSTAIECRASAPASNVDLDGDDDGDGRRGLRADGSRYTYMWKTSRSWAGTCRKLIVKLDDGTAHEVLFRFRSSRGERDSARESERNSSRGERDDDDDDVDDDD